MHFGSDKDTDKKTPMIAAKFQKLLEVTLHRVEGSKFRKHIIVCTILDEFLKNIKCIKK